MIDTSHTAGIRTVAPMDVRQDRYSWTAQDMIKIDIISNKTNRSLALIKTANSYPYLHAKTGNIYPYKRELFAVFYIKKLRTIFTSKMLLEQCKIH
jgi:hypothetical protein